MSATDKHYIGYHNTEKMGYGLDSQSAFKVLTNKSTKPFAGNLIWMIRGVGNKPREFFLCSVFRATETGDTGDDSFKHFAQGQGICFDPQINLTQLEWFDTLSKTVGRFSFGVQELKDEKLIQHLQDIANIDALP